MHTDEKMPPPTNLIVETTSVCNLACVMCEHSHKNFANRPKMHLPGSIRDKLIPFVKVVDRIQLHGIGEPLLSPVFWELLPNIKPNITAASINSNFHIIDTEKMHRLLQSNLTAINISLDSPDSETYYKIRGGDLQQPITNIKKFIQLREQTNSKLQVLINMTLMKINYKQIQQMIDLADKLRVDSVQVWPVNLVDPNNEFFNRKIRSWEYIYSEQSPHFFKEQFNQEIKNAIDYANKKNMSFTSFYI